MTIDETALIESRVCRTRRIKLTNGVRYFFGKVYKHNGKLLIRKTNVANKRKEPSLILTRESGNDTLWDMGGLDAIIDELLIA